MASLQDLPEELQVLIARTIDAGERTELSLVNRAWNRICTPVIWEDITLWYSRDANGRDHFGPEKSLCHPPEVVDEYLPRYVKHLRRVKVEVGPPWQDDMALLVRAVRLIPDSVEITLEADFSCDVYVEIAEPEDLDDSLAILAQVAHRFVSIHLDTILGYSIVDEVMNALAAFFKSPVECRTFLLRTDVTLSGVLPLVLGLPKLEDLTVKVDDLAELDISLLPERPLQSLSIIVVEDNNAQVACEVVKKYAGDLQRLILCGCSWSDHHGTPVAFPNLKSLTVQARRGPINLFELIDPRAYPHLQDITHPGIETERLVKQLPAFLDALGSKIRRPRLRLHLQSLDFAEDEYRDHVTDPDLYPDNLSIRLELRRICEERGVDVLEYDFESLSR